jgi:hypothetical protein
MKYSKEAYQSAPPPYEEPYLPGSVIQHPAPPLQPQYQPMYVHPHGKYNYSKDSTRQQNTGTFGKSRNCVWFSDHTPQTKQDGRLNSSIIQKLEKFVQYSGYIWSGFQSPVLP